MKALPVVLTLAALYATSLAVLAKPIPAPKLPSSEIQKSLRTDPIEISIDNLALPIKSRDEFRESLIPKDVLELDGKRVRMIGQMFPEFEKVGLKQFTFNGDTCQKTYSMGTIDSAPVQLFIPVNLRKGNTITFTLAPIQIEGQLSIKPIMMEGRLSTLFQIEDAILIPAEREEGFYPSFNIFGC
jgi:hypothetical protein